MIKVSELKVNINYKEMVPPLSKEDFNNLKDSIEKDGVEIPLILNQDCVVLDGHHRLQICKDLGIPEVDYRKKFFEDKLLEEEFVISCNLNRRHLNNAQKTELGLKILGLEKRKAKERQLSGLKQFKKEDPTVVPIKAQRKDDPLNEVDRIFNAKPVDPYKKEENGRANDNQMEHLDPASTQYARLFHENEKLSKIITGQV